MMFARIFASSASSAPPFLRAKLPVLPVPTPPRSSGTASSILATAGVELVPRIRRVKVDALRIAHAQHIRDGVPSARPPAPQPFEVPPEPRARSLSQHAPRGRPPCRPSWVHPSGQAAPCQRVQPSALLSPQHPRSARSFRAAGHHAAPARFQRQQRRAIRHTVRGKTKHAKGVKHFFVLLSKFLVCKKRALAVQPQ